MNWKQKKRITRILATIFAVMFIILCALSSCGGTEKKAIKPETPKERIKYARVIEYEVGPFETLSHIAVKFIPSDDYMPKWIEDVQKLNGRKNSTIYSGETIKVYVYE